MKESADQEEKETLAEFRSRFNQSKQHSNDWREEAKNLNDLRAGHQWSPEDEAALKTKYKGAYPMVTFNLSDKYNDAISGMQINNRQEIRYFPRKVGVVSIDEYATGVVKWNRDQCEAEDEESDMFTDVFWLGMGWIEHFLDDTNGPESWIAQERRDPMEMYWDPMARKKNLSDRQWQIRIKPMTPGEYEDFFGEEEGSSLEDTSTEFGDDGTIQVIQNPHDYGDSTGGSSTVRPIYVADYQWWEMDTQYTVTALFPGQQQPMTQTFDEEEWSKIKKVLNKTATPYQVKESQYKCYYRCWIAGDGIKEVNGTKIKKLTCNSFTYEAITGKRDRNSNTWYGMGRAVRDPQMWVNKFFSNILYTLSVNAKGGLMAEESAFEDQAKAERSWADPAAITFVGDGAISGGKIQPKPAPPYPQGMDRLMTFALEAMPMTSGLNPEMLGLTGRDQANVLEENRKKSAMAIVAWVFDAMRRYYKRSGKLMLAMIREYLDDGQLIKITGPQGAQYVQLMKDKLEDSYDMVVDESPTSTNMQERVWGILLQMIELSAKMGKPVPVEIIDYSPIPDDLKQKWKQTLQGDPQKQQQHEDMAIRGQEAKIAVDESKAAQQQADAQLKAVEAKTGEMAAPAKIALDQIEGVHKAAQAGHLQAGGGN